MNEKYVNILGVNFLHTDMQSMVKRLMDHIKNEEKSFVVTANPEIVMQSLQDVKYKQMVNKASYVLADGIGVVKGASLLGQPLPERVAGYDLMRNLLAASNEHPFRVYMLGAKDEVLTKAIATLKEEYPQLVIAGSHHGYFELNDEKVRKDIIASKADLILVALGFPRQEQWISSHFDSFDKGVFIGVGGSFDVLAGTVKRAPLIWQKLNIEWLYRLMKQPSRWRRMLALPQFALKVMAQKAKGKRSYEK